MFARHFDYLNFSTFGLVEQYMKMKTYSENEKNISGKSTMWKWSNERNSNPSLQIKESGIPKNDEKSKAKFGIIAILKEKMECS